MPWRLLITQNLTDAEDVGVAIPQGGVSDQDLYVFTGSVVKHDDCFTIFYTAHNDRLVGNGGMMQTIRKAVSKDLIHWEKIAGFEITVPAFLQKDDFRDPFVFFDEEKDTYRMIITSRKKDAVSRRAGVFAQAFSKDLEHWEISDELFFESDMYYAMECPDLFKMGDWWYLVFSEFTEKRTTRYMMSKSVDGPWISPENNSIDGTAFYAGKTAASDDGRRFIFGWNPIKSDNKDENEFQFGGAIVPHEIYPLDDGRLAVKCPQEVLDYYAAPASPPAAGVLDGTMRFASRLFENSLNSFRFETYITYQGGDEFGLLLNYLPETDEGYYIKFEPAHNRLCFDRWNRSCQYRHFDVETERFLSVDKGQQIHVTAICEGSILEVYVDGRVAMSARMYAKKGAYCGVYTLNARIDISGTQLFSKEV
jgi:beta-fructofuranosidase